MNEQATFRGDRNLILAFFMLLLGVGCFIFPFFFNEDDILSSRARRSGILKLIEQTVGWELFCLLILVFGAWALAMGIAVLWKAIDSTPDVTATYEGMTFHPAVRRTPASYEDVDYWKIEIVSGHPVVWIYLFDSYWALQGMFPRKTVKLEGSREDLEPIVAYFDSHPEMAAKFLGG
jgi:hypothetical protein